MKASLLLPAALAALMCAPAFAQRSAVATVPEKDAKISKQIITAPETGSPNTPIVPMRVQQPAPLNLRGGAVSTGLSGFYDYQSNGMSPGYIYVSPTNPDQIHTTYMLATDGTDASTISSSRRVGYAYSSDGGKTWKSTSAVGGIRLGFPYVMANNEGVAFIVAHGGSELRTKLFFNNGLGDLNFGLLADLGLTTASGAPNGVIWPTFTLTKDEQKAVVLGSYSNDAANDEPQEPLQVASVDLNSGTAGPWQALTTDPTNSLTSGGRDIIARSPGGKLGAAWYRFSTDTTGVDQDYGIWFAESEDNGTTWGTPRRILTGDQVQDFFDPGINGDADTLNAGANLDLAYNGENAHLVFTSAINGLYREEWVMHWSAEDNQIRVITRAHQTETANREMGLGAYSVPAVIAQSNMLPLAYPTISVGNDGQHILVAFSAVEQHLNETRDTILPGTVSPDGFFYYRVWGVGSADNGVTWGQPFLIQDFAGNGTDSASIEYPSLNESSRVIGDNFEMNLVFQARRFPGMYAFTATNATAGPVSEVGQYFQRTQLPKTLFQPVPTSVKVIPTGASKLAITRSYPNPAMSRMMLDYDLASSGPVTVKIVNVLGDELLIPINGEQSSAGSYTKVVDLSTLPAGPYRIVLTQNGVSTSQPLSIVR